MAGDLYCFLTAVLTIAATIFMVRIAFANRPRPLFDGWRDVIDGWRYVRGLAERAFFLVLLIRFLKGPAFIVTVAVLLTAVGAAATAVCGWDAEELRIVHEIIKDLIKAFENAGAAAQAR